LPDIPRAGHDRRDLPVVRRQRRDHDPAVGDLGDPLPQRPARTRHFVALIVSMKSASARPSARRWASATSAGDGGVSAMWWAIPRTIWAALRCAARSRNVGPTSLDPSVEWQAWQPSVTYSLPPRTTRSSIGRV